MEPKNNNDVKTDLRHDSMEYSASTDGDDILDDDLEIEEEDISAEELDELEDESVENDEAALLAVEQDRLKDPENLPEESDEDDYYDNEEKNQIDEEHQR